MSILNIFLIFIGVFQFFMFVTWSTKDWFNVAVKIIYFASSIYLVLYAMYLSGFLIVLKM